MTTMPKHFLSPRWCFILLSLLVSAFLLPQAAIAKKKKYTKAQIKAAIKQARKDAVKKAIKKNAELKKYKKAKISIEKKLSKGSCKTKTKKNGKKRTYCVRYRKGKAAVYINGKHKPVLSGLHRATKNTINKLKTTFKKLGDEFKVLGKKIKVLTKKIEEKTIKAFGEKIRKFKALVKAKTKKILGGWKGKIVEEVAMQVSDKLPEAFAKIKGKSGEKLRRILKNRKGYKAVKRAMSTKMSMAKAAKAYGKAVAGAVALSISAQALTVSHRCWKFSGNKKRSCLKRELPLVVQETTFVVLSALVGAAVDIAVIDPMSLALAAAVSSALAAATAGVGVAGYPIVYGISSVSLNLSVFASLEFGIKKGYDKLYNKVLGAKVKRAMSSIVSGLPSTILKCWGPKKICVK